MDNVLVQIVIALIIVILMGYISYNIYSIEYDKLFKYNSTKKEIPIFSGVMDYYNTTDFKINTNNIGFNTGQIDPGLAAAANNIAAQANNAVNTASRQSIEAVSNVAKSKIKGLLG